MALQLPSRKSRILFTCLLITLSLLPACGTKPTALTALPPPGETAAAATETPVPSPTDTPRPTDTQPPPPTPLDPTQTAWITVVIPPDQPTTTQELPALDGVISPTPTRTRIPTRTPPPPSASLQIQKPGPYSKVLSPIPLRAVVVPGEDKQVYVDLIGEDGRVITSQRLDYTRATDRYIYTSADIPFEISSLAETARLVLHTVDRFNRTIYQTSIDLILIQIGDNQINPPRSEQEPYVIRAPWEGATVRGGVMTVEGQARLINDQPLIFELFDEDGNLVGSAQTDVAQPSDVQPYVPFSLLVPYSVSKWTSVRLNAHQESANRIPGTVWLSSVIVYLEP